MTKTVSELRAAAKLPAKQAGGSTVADFFKLNQSAIAAVLPKHVGPDRMLKIALSALRTTPGLMNATSESLLGGVIACAQLGLEPNTPLGHAFIAPFANRRENRTDVQVIMGYRGMIDLARRSGQVVSISAHAVREADHFDYEYGLDEALRHKPSTSADRGEITHVYAVAKLVGGGYQFEVMPRAEIDRIMSMSQSRGKYGPWRDHFEEMARKTAIRRLFKYLPMSIEMAVAAELDSRADAGIEQNLGGVIAGEWDVLATDGGYNSEPQPEPEPEPVPQPEPPSRSPTAAEADLEDLLAAIKEADDISSLDSLAESINAMRQGKMRRRAEDAFTERLNALKS